MPRVNLAVVLVKVFPESHNGKEQDKHFMYKMKWLIFAARRGRNAELCSSRCSVWAMKNALEATKAYASIVEARLALNRQHPDVRRRDWDKLKPKLRQGRYFPPSADQYCLASIGQRYSPSPSIHATAIRSPRHLGIQNPLEEPRHASPFPQRVSPKPVLTTAAMRVNTIKHIRSGVTLCPQTRV